MTSWNRAAYLWACYLRETYFVLATVCVISLLQWFSLYLVYFVLREAILHIAQMTPGALSPALG